MSNIPPDLTHMPSHIKQMIVNSSDTETKLCQRALSQEFKCEVDKAPIRYFELKMVIYNDLVQISRRITEGGHVNEREFYATSNCCSMKNNMEEYEKEMKEYSLKAAVAKLLSIFKHSKVSVEKLIIEEFLEIRHYQANNAAVFDDFNRILSLKPFLIRVEKLSFEFKINQQQILSILRYLKPITLKELEVDSFTEDDRRRGFDEIVQTEQWMGLERVYILGLQMGIPPERLSHLNTVVIQLSTPPTETIVRILEVFLLKPTLERLLLDWDSGDLDTTRAKEYVGRFEKIPERCSEMEDCISLPYEGNNIVYIMIQESIVKVHRNSTSESMRLRR